MKLMQFHQQLLNAVGLTYDAEGFVSNRIDSKTTEPLTIKGQRLVLATDEQLSNPEWEGRVVFNPMYESLSRKESPVHEAFRTMLNVRQNTIFGILVGRMIEIARDTGIHSTLTAEQTEYLSHAKKVDTKEGEKNETIKSYAKLLDAFPGDRAFVNIYSKAGGTVKGEKYARAAIVSFPIYEALVAAQDGVVKAPGKDVKMRSKDIDTFKALIEHIVPKIAEKHFYDVGSVSNQAPTMESMLKAAAAIFNVLNMQLELFHDRIPEVKSLLTGMEWADELDNIGSLYRQARDIGMMNGNDGAPLNAPTAPAAAAPAHQSATAAAAPEVKEQVKINPITGEPVVFTSAPAPVASFTKPNVGPATPTTWGTPTFTGMSGGFSAPAPVSTVKSNGKADMAAILRSNPALAASIGVNAQPAMQVAQERTPTWATGSPGFSGFGSAPARRSF